ncbi:MAG: amidohydrolase family protein [Alphaproteobacteria bacterium]|nr:amidohydrolase family protein [Alphaproteobacteria bacterium]
MIDAHHHIWRQADLPWLNGPDQPRIFGAYDALKRDYPVEEYLDDRAGTGVEKSVYVQVNWAPDRFEDEVAWVEAVAVDHGWPNAIVGYADFTADDVRPQLDRLAKYPLMRGLRQQLHWHETPAYRFAARPDLAADPTLRANIAHLADYGWSFDLQVFAGQMEAAAGLAASCPGVTFILQHAGMLEDTSDSGWQAWRAGMERLAACGNVVTKLSAFGTFIHRNDPDFIAAMIEETVGIFGADRCLFGSNFPIEKLWTEYSALVGAFRSGAAGLSVAQQDAIFGGTAARVYRL